MVFGWLNSTARCLVWRKWEDKLQFCIFQFSFFLIEAIRAKKWWLEILSDIIHTCVAQFTILKGNSDLTLFMGRCRSWKWFWKEYFSWWCCSALFFLAEFSRFFLLSSKHPHLCRSELRERRTRPVKKVMQSNASKTEYVCIYLKTFVDSFLTLENSSRFLVILLYCKNAEFGRIKKNFQGAKKNLQGFFFEKKL